MLFAAVIRSAEWKLGIKMSPGPRPSSHDGTQRPGLHWPGLAWSPGAAQI